MLNLAKLARPNSAETTTGDEGIKESAAGSIFRDTLRHTADAEEVDQTMNPFATFGRSSHTLQGLLERSFRAHGPRPAIYTRDGVVSYDELSLQARRLARYLDAEYEAAAGSPRLLGVYGIYGEEPIAALCGAVVAGGGYVPLNPSFPAERTGYMVRDSGVRVVYVCDRAADDLERLLPYVPEGVCVIVPDVLLSQASSYPAVRFVGKSVLRGQPVEVDFPEIPENACAYILYTSGSTGVPKGVMVSHANVVHHVRELASLYGFNEEDRFSQTFDLTFDLSVIGVYGAFISGGCVCPMEKMEKLNPAAYVNRRGITVWSSVPSVVVNMRKLRMLEPACMPTLRVSVFCGEPLTAACASQWQAAACHSLVENTYGPTEATVLCSRFRWDAEAESREYANGIVPIGYPLPGTGLAVVDNDNRFLNGEPGELCIAGPQVCLGYTDPKHNDKAFFYAEDPRYRVRQRWYKTGDLVVRSPNGDWLEFLGRIDSQVKVLGNRIELGEVESVLREAYGCDAVIVVPYPVEDGSAKGLVAFLEQFADGAAEAAMRQACGRRLPSYMHPARYFFLPALPVNANGKYDRKALYRACEQLATSQ
jgi:amino acid adenylation domain-containing protein